MIIMLNGSFGVGKSSVAEDLVQRIPRAMLFDPETVGALVRYITNGVRTPEETTDDFQDIAIWRTLTVTTAQQLYHQYQRPLVVPMTIVNREYLDFIRTGFSSIAPVLHFSLMAPLSTIEKRLAGRGHGEGSWPLQKAQQIVSRFSDPYYEKHIDTENRPVSAIAEEILDHLPQNKFAGC